MKPRLQKQRAKVIFFFMVDSSCYFLGVGFFIRTAFLVSFDAEQADDLARAGIDGGAGLFPVVRLDQGALVGLADSVPTLIFAMPFAMPSRMHWLLMPEAAVQHRQDARDLAEVGGMLDVQRASGFFWLRTPSAIAPWMEPTATLQPVALRLFRKLLRLVQIGEALLRAEDLFIVHVRACALVARGGAELGLAGDVICVREVCDLLRDSDVLLKGQAAAVDHDGLITCLDGTLRNGHIVHAFLILVDDGHMVEVQQGCISGHNT